MQDFALLVIFLHLLHSIQLVKAYLQASFVAIVAPQSETVGSFLANGAVAAENFFFDAFLVTAEMKVMGAGCLNDRTVLVTYFAFLVTVGHFLPGRHLRFFLFDLFRLEALQIADHKYEYGNYQSKSAYCQH